MYVCIYIYIYGFYTALLQLYFGILFIVPVSASASQRWPLALPSSLSLSLSLSLRATESSLLRPAAKRRRLIFLYKKLAFTHSNYFLGYFYFILRK